MKLIILLTILLAFFNTSYTQRLDKAKLDQFFDRLAEKSKAMGSLTIAKDGKSVYTRTIGYSQINETKKIPLNAANRFRIGSITKMFTAALVLQFAEQGKLKLTDTLDKFFPQIPNANKITIAQILTHRSGIHDSILDKNLRSSPNTNPITKDEMFALIAKGTPDFEPDTKQSYSNSGYLILGLILEKISGKSYEKILQEKITSKLGLKDTYVANGNIDISKNESLTYFMLGGEWKQHHETHPSLLFSAGAVISTPNDLVKFIQALFDGKIISKKSLEQMKPIKDGDWLMMETFKFAGKTFYGHTGGADNYGAWLAFLPEENLAFAYTTNAKVYPVKDIVSGVFDIYYNKPFEVPTFEIITVSPEILDKYVGVYSNPEVPVKFTITRKDNTLYVQPGEQSAAPLAATDEKTFEITGASGIIFEFDTEKNQMIQKRGGRARVFMKEK